MELLVSQSVLSQVFKYAFIANESLVNLFLAYYSENRCQWSIEGYFYPIQISQFALVSYSKNLTDPEEKKSKNYLIREETSNCDWYHGSLKFPIGPTDGDDKDSKKNQICAINIEESSLFKIQMTVKLEQGSAITVFGEVKDGKSGKLKTYKIAYIADTVPELGFRFCS